MNGNSHNKTPSPEQRDRERPPACNWSGTAASFALGLLPDGEHADYSSHLVQGCGPCGAELALARERIALVDRSLAENPDSERNERERDASLARVRSKLRRAIALEESPTSIPGAANETSEGHGSRTSQTGLDAARPTSVPGVSFVPRDEAGWESTQVEGVEFKTLSIDPERRYVTTLMRMAPGARYPAHRHAGREECYVLSGDLCLGEERLGPGDFQVAQAGSTHPEHFSETGCMALIVASLDNQPV